MTLTTEEMTLVHDLDPSPPGDDPEYESSVDNDDDISSDDDPEAHKLESEVSCAGASVGRGQCAGNELHGMQA